MAKYIFTDSMKRHERSALCIKLHREIYNSRKMYYLINQLWGAIDTKIKRQNKFRPSNEPIFAITACTYKNVPYYVFCYKEKNMEMVFNTSPIDAAYVEFTRIVDNATISTMVFTQHALDRYNERVHGKKYDNHKDRMKRLMLNNSMLNAQISNHEHKIVMKVKEGFLSGTADAAHKILVFNTFFDKVELEDNKLQHKARSQYDVMNAMTPEQREVFHELRKQYKAGELTLEQLVEQFVIHDMPTNERIKEVKDQQTPLPHLTGTQPRLHSQHPQDPYAQNPRLPRAC